MNLPIRWSVPAALFLLIGSWPAARAQEGATPAKRTITVTGVGSVKVVADTVRLTVTIAAVGETAKLGHDALQTNTRKFREALDGLKIASLSVQGGPLVVQVLTSPAAKKAKGGFGGANPPGVAPRSNYVTQSFSLTLKRGAGVREEFQPLLDQMNRVILASAESGVTVDTEEDLLPSSVRFRLRNELTSRPVFSHARENDFRKKALDLALADALANAERVAGGAKVRILRTASITQMAPKETAPSRPEYDPITGEKEIVIHISVTCEY